MSLKCLHIAPNAKTPMKTMITAGNTRSGNFFCTTTLFLYLEKNGAEEMNISTELIKGRVSGISMFTEDLVMERDMTR